MIHLLPALPADWKTGSFKGLKARGGLEVDIKWDNGELVEARILSSKDRKIRIKYKGEYHEVELKTGKGYVFSL